ncbi:MAG: hypothetical protein K2M76_01835, partial [Muribaculaceae bacterium]|nr:hypothetical protein [Muribaculaceae bacterium]
MEDLQQAVISVILKDIADGIPFFAYALPGDNTVHICHTVRISLFGSDAEIVGLNGEAAMTPLPYACSTRYDEYVDSLDRIVARLKADGGKTVISRTIAGYGVLNVDKLFNNTDPQAFR